ncbi:GNAT family N-acetyltransferase [Herbihabitans rhizosphaerae]|uniref:GNAT family N-acetyltransferase n=1 Tax=Herbihabitans rhizosphaerae TaxID=1872711 RepID=UPI0030FE25C3
MPLLSDDVRDLEFLCAEAWPAMVSERLGDWLLRAAGGFTGRANSALVLGDPGVPVPDALATVIDFSAKHGITPKVQVVWGDPTEAAIAAAGWTVDTGHSGEHGVVVLTGPLDLDERAGTVLDHPTPAWWRLVSGTETPAPAERHVLAGGALTGFGVTAVHGETVAAVRGGVAGDVLLVARLAVRADARRHGHARRLLGTLAAWGRGHGARRMVLQVTAGNTAALRLYETLGCVEHHRYQYWTPSNVSCVLLHW